MIFYLTAFTLGILALISGSLAGLIAGLFFAGLGIISERFK
jgi:hypothetical protein